MARIDEYEAKSSEAPGHFHDLAGAAAAAEDAARSVVNTISQHTSDTTHILSDIQASLGSLQGKAHDRSQEFQDACGHLQQDVQTFKQHLETRGAHLTQTYSVAHNSALALIQRISGGSALLNQATQHIGQTCAHMTSTLHAQGETFAASHQRVMTTMGSLHDEITRGQQVMDGMTQSLVAAVDQNQSHSTAAVTGFGHESDTLAQSFGTEMAHLRTAIMEPKAAAIALQAQQRLHEELEAAVQHAVTAIQHVVEDMEHKLLGGASDLSGLQGALRSLLDGVTGRPDAIHIQAQSVLDKKDRMEARHDELTDRRDHLQAELHDKQVERYHLESNHGGNYHDN